MTTCHWHVVALDNHWRSTDLHKVEEAILHNEGSPEWWNFPAFQANERTGVLLITTFARDEPVPASVWFSQFGSVTTFDDPQPATAHFETIVRIRTNDDAHLGAREEGYRP